MKDFYTIEGKEQKTPENQIESIRTNLLQDIISSLNNTNSGTLTLKLKENSTSVYILEFQGKEDKEKGKSPTVNSGYFGKIFNLLNNIKQQTTFEYINIFDEIEKINISETEEIKALDNVESETTDGNGNKIKKIESNPFISMNKVKNMFTELEIKSTFKPEEEKPVYKVTYKDNIKEYPAEQFYSLCRKINFLFSVENN
jgi:hypothetical protein